MAIGRYVAVSTDLTNKVIVEGPFLWDGNLATWQPPTGTTAIFESAALAQGYTWPPAEGTG
jgi:hypothetical protein